MAHDTLGDLAAIAGTSSELRCRLAGGQWHARLERIHLPPDHLFKTEATGKGATFEEAIDVLVRDFERRTKGT